MQFQDQGSVQNEESASGNGQIAQQDRKNSARRFFDVLKSHFAPVKTWARERGREVAFASATLTLFFVLVMRAIWPTFMSSTTSLVIGFFSILFPVYVYVTESRKLLRVSTSLNTISKNINHALFNEVTFQIFSSLLQNDKLNERMWSPSKEKKIELAKTVHSASVTKNGKSIPLFEHLIIGRRIFIESGSTYAYLALSLAAFLKHRKPEEKSNVITNNVLVYITLLFNKFVNAEIYPGTPLDKYGATYGNSDLPEEKELRMILGDVDLLLMAISGLSINFGLHVGSEVNARFKSALLKIAIDQNIPTLLLMDDSKIEDDSSPPNPAICKRVSANEENTNGFDERGFEELIALVESGILYIAICENRSGQSQRTAKFLAKIRKNNATSFTLENGEFRTHIVYGKSPLEIDRLGKFRDTLISAL